MIENIVFDMGNVLIRYDPLDYVAKHTDDAADRAALLREVFHSVEWVRQDRGSITDDEAVAGISARLPERLRGAVRSLIENWHRELQPIPGMADIVRGLKAAGYGVYLLSNTGWRYREFRLGMPALECFDGEFISCDWHLLKPNELIYLTFCHHFSLSPHSCFFIDDSPLNIEGAINAGMRGFVFHGDTEALKAALNEAGVSINGAICSGSDTPKAKRLSAF
jgi:putative hydrolase of the HAD superfamily